MNLRDVLEWILGVVVTGLGAILLVAPPVGIPIFLVGLYILPPVRRRVTIDIPAVWLAGWLGGICLLLVGAVAMLRVPLGGILAIVGGIIAIPALREQIVGWLSVDPGRITVAVVVLLAAAGAGAVFTIQQDELFNRSAETHDIGDQFVVSTDDSQLRMNVTHAVTTRPLRLKDHPWEDPERDTFLLITIQITNTGEEAVAFESEDIAVIGTDGNTTFHPSDVSRNITKSGRYRAPGISFENETARIPAGETVNRTIAFDVTTGHTYLFTLLPTAQDMTEDRHYVPLGDVTGGEDEA
ncbi:DUF4352 domain-containing protein [Halorientalis salina]|uniref:DUF4352 domain-containing protein n=1 Tax=Halorientalis salina TaxID=2932266 RepID=UPI0010AC7766|nr:DUF4352 domain-containing protein [Halorientalis salina]